MQQELNYEKTFHTWFERYKYQSGVQDNDKIFFHRMIASNDYTCYTEIIARFIRSCLHINWNPDRSIYKNILFSELYYIEKVIEILYVELFDRKKNRVIKHLHEILLFHRYLQNKDDIFDKLMRIAKRQFFNLPVHEFCEESIAKISNTRLKSICINYNIKEFLMHVCMDEKQPLNHNVKIDDERIYIYIQDEIREIEYKDFRRMIVSNFEKKMHSLYLEYFIHRVKAHEMVLFHNNLLLKNLNDDFDEFYISDYKAWLKRSSIYFDINELNQSPN